MLAFLLFLTLFQGLLAYIEEVIHLYFSLYKCFVSISIPVQWKWGCQIKCITKKETTRENSLPSLLLPMLDLSIWPVCRWSGLQRKTKEVYCVNTRCIPPSTIKLQLYTWILKIQPIITFTVFLKCGLQGVQLLNQYILPVFLFKYCLTVIWHWD